MFLAGTGEELIGLGVAKCLRPRFTSKPLKPVCLDEWEVDTCASTDDTDQASNCVDEVDQARQFPLFASRSSNEGEEADTQAEEIGWPNEIDRTRLIFERRVGSGTTAEVFEGWYNDEKVAIKEIETQTRKELCQMNAFVREVAVMSKVTHANLVNFIGVSLSEWPLRVITEFCEGGTMYNLLHEDDDVMLLWSQNLKMCLDVAHAMDYLHSFKPQIIHRDLKSLNLLLLQSVRSTSDVPVVKVSDFGLSRIKDADTKSQWGALTRYAGTCHWMAPEVASGVYDEKVDVYSFAMVLFEIICREIPFEDVGVKEVLAFISDGFRPDMEAVPPDCPKVLSELMIICWAHRAHSRPPFSQISETLSRIAAAV